jgi:hypothetical protein
MVLSTIAHALKWKRHSIDIEDWTSYVLFRHLIIYYAHMLSPRNTSFSLPKINLAGANWSGSVVPVTQQMINKKCFIVFNINPY